ncbi:MAG: hypothetical protein GXO25_07105 [Euryarchaeota archaeon]|nr:hypothetical protein [Euryarchaeota archaeon]
MMDKNTAMKKYREAKTEGRVDQDIIPLLEKINSIPGYYTTSSCSGRIVLMELPMIGDKVNSRFLGKWHYEIKEETLTRAMEEYHSGMLMFMVQSAIIHIVAENLEKSRSLLILAKEAGFKYSSIRNITHHGILLEILSTENLSVPLGKDGIIMTNKEYISFLSEMGNITLRRVKDKLKRFEEKLNFLPPSSF